MSSLELGRKGDSVDGSAPSFEQIRCDVDDRIMTITLNRPDRRNAITKQMVEELTAAFGLADEDDRVRCIVVTGAGSTFCAGMDLQIKGHHGGNPFEFASPRLHRDRTGDLTIRIFESAKPVIGAVNGAAAGLGATMLLPMDIRLSSNNAKFGFVFTRRGITPDGASTWFLPRVVGIGKALEWLTTGRVFGPDEALRAGLLSAVHAADELLPAAYAIAREIADNTSPVCVALTRQMAWRMLGADHPRDANELESRCLGLAGSRPDAQEGVAAFLEKRLPRFSSRVSSDMPDFYPWWSPREFTPLP